MHEKCGASRFTRSVKLIHFHRNRSNCREFGLILYSPNKFASELFVYSAAMSFQQLDQVFKSIKYTKMEIKDVIIKEKYGQKITNDGKIVTMLQLKVNGRIYHESIAGCYVMV